MHKNLISLIFLITIALGSDTSRVVETYNNGKISSISYFKDTEKGLELFKQEVFHFTGKMSMAGTFENGFCLINVHNPDFNSVSFEISFFKSKESYFWSFLIDIDSTILRLPNLISETFPDIELVYIGSLLFLSKNKGQVDQCIQEIIDLPD